MVRSAKRYGAKDRAFVLYGGILSTFLVDGFLFDETGASSGGRIGGTSVSFAVALEQVFVSAVFARVVTFPVEYVC